MKVILQREVDKLGAPGDVVIVADGFARNYLIPRGLAAPAAKGAVRHADRLKRTHEERVRRDVEEARAIAERLSASPLQMPARAGEEGRLFGSITVSDVADAVEEFLGAPIDRKRLHLAEPIRSVGTHEVVLHLHTEVTATVTIEVVPK
jgi:large subunit ribosomal protein L9